MVIKTQLSHKIILLLFGLFLTTIILEIGLRIGGFMILSIQEYRNLQSIKQKGSFRIMCIGESTTQCQYPPYLEEILNQRNIGIKFSVIDKGLGATNTTAILAQLEPNLDKYKPDMVITMMGINDYGTHIPYDIFTASKKNILRSFKIYKLAKLSWAHILARYGQATCKQVDSRQIAMENNKDINVYSGSEKSCATENKSIEELFKEVHLNENQSKSHYINLGRFYCSEQTRFQDGAKCFRKALKLDPSDSDIYRELGEIYYNDCKTSEAQDCFLKSLELNPKDSFAYRSLALLYRDRCENKFKESEKCFKKAIKLNQKEHSFYYELGCLYFRQPSLLAEAQKCLIKAIELSSGDDTYYGALAEIYRKMVQYQLSEDYYEKANKVRLNRYRIDTRNNYIKLKQILDKRKIQLVCVQYPVRNIESLKKIFEGEKGIIFVDNEKIFKRALRASRYEDYFSDMFGGDFGHCTEKGNRLLAENIADAIIKYFKIDTFFSKK